MIKLIYKYRNKLTISNKNINKILKNKCNKINKITK